MTALGEAIAAGRSATTLSAQSPLHGMRRRTVSTIDLVAQSFAAVAPAGVLLMNPVGMFARGGSFAALEFGLTIAIIALVAMGIAVFARRIAAAGSLYTFVTRGLGGTVGMAAGVALALGYTMLAVSTLRGAASQISALTTGSSPWRSSTPGGDIPVHSVVVAIAVILAVGLVIGLVVIRGARPSTRVMLGIEITAVALILGLSFIVLNATGWDLSALVPDISQAPSFTSIVSAVGFGLIAFVGFESGVALGPESRRPLATVPRTLFWTVSALGLVYLVGVFAQFAVIGRSSHDSFESLFQVASAHVQLPGLGAGTHIVVAASFAACSLACTSALVRLVFTMAREGVLPHALGRTSRRFGTPHLATIAIVTVIGILAIVSLLTRESLLGSVIGLASTLGFAIAYLLVCLAGPAFLVRLREFTLREAVPSALAATALAIIVVSQILTATDQRLAAALIIVAIVVGVALLHTIRLRRNPLVRSRSGLYDSPVASDGLGSVPHSADDPAEVTRHHE